MIYQFRRPVGVLVRRRRYEALERYRWRRWTIAGRLGFIKPHPTQHAIMAGNKNPHLAWGEVSRDAKSLVLLMHDNDAPSNRALVNKTDKTVPYGFPRVKFIH